MTEINFKNILIINYYHIWKDTYYNYNIKYYILNWNIMILINSIIDLSIKQNKTIVNNNMCSLFIIRTNWIKILNV